MPPCNARGRTRLLPGARGACVVHGARGNSKEKDDENYQKSVMGGGANSPGGNVGGVRGAPLMTIGGAEFMQGVFIAIKQIMRVTWNVDHCGTGMRYGNAVHHILRNVKFEIVEISFEELEPMVLNLGHELLNHVLYVDLCSFHLLVVAALVGFHHCHHLKNSNASLLVLLGNPP
ncbi:hypothetical protein Acr_05g0010360 [Actinidia rufa]|uniref:Uncharacterized protein n=1 Tax=Actinidia rufa TaxID=165716 RepID=A0A7J0EPA7_9ERIC|nr:hypothetical protein Acr_05g0010360 [Actinidia rufa]